MRLYIISALLLLLLGCAPTTAGISIDSSNQHVVLSDSDLSQQLQFGDAKANKHQGRLMSSVMVHNLTDSTLPLAYRFYWYDEQGLELNTDQSPWQHIILYGGERRALQGVAINQNAENYRIFIRRAP